ncbi:MAG: tetratricopeptide repeat protein [Isosphaeraceae bacterium]
MREQGKLDEAVEEHHTVIRLQPDFADAHSNLGRSLHEQGKHDEAVAEYRTAIRLKPDLAFAHYNLGNALRDQGKRDEAMEEFRTAIRVKPDHAEAHCNLGQLLRRRGDHAGAVSELRKGHELGSRRPDWRYPSAQWLADAEALAAMAGRLPRILRGEDKPANPAEGLAAGRHCYDRGLHAAAARLLKEALDADPRLAVDRNAGHRYNAACTAALAGCGKSKDDPPPDEAARTSLRDQARQWLAADLAEWSKSLDSGGPQARPGTARVLAHWKEDPDLAGIRDPEALQKLPEAERKEWQALWSEVDRLLGRATMAK